MFKDPHKDLYHEIWIYIKLLENYIHTKIDVSLTVTQTY